MAIDNYGQLKSALADWLMRDDLTSVIPTFVTLAHKSLNRQVRVRQMMKRAVAEVDSQFSVLPADFLEMRNIQLNNSVPSPLQHITAEQMDEYRYANNNVAGRPGYYAIVGESIELYPTPNAAYNMEMAYYSKIPALSDDSSSNWLLLKAPDAYLYGALVQAAPYLKEDERIQVWSMLHEKALTELRDEEERARFMGTTPKFKGRTFG